MAGNEEFRQLQGRQRALGTRHHVGPEGGDAGMVDEVYPVVIVVHAHAVDVFLAVEAVVVDVVDEHLLLGIVVPQAARRGAPEVAVVGLDDVAHHQVLQPVVRWKQHGLLRAGLVEVQPLLGADEDVAVAGFAQRVAQDAVQQLSPAVAHETVGHGVVARHA